MSDSVVKQGVIKDKPVKDSRSERDQKKALRDLTEREENGELSMHVLIHSPFRDYYDGPAFSVSGENATGPFDILPKHHNFISLLSPCDLVVRTVIEGEQRIRISGGIMHVKADRVIVFLDV